MSTPQCGLADCDCGYTIDKLAAALKAVEWPVEHGEDYCLVCLRDMCAGHADDCIVGIALAEAKP